MVVLICVDRGTDLIDCGVGVEAGVDVGLMGLDLGTGVGVGVVEAHVSQASDADLFSLDGKAMTAPAVAIINDTRMIEALGVIDSSLSFCHVVF